jgi:hypothetical protein
MQKRRAKMRKKISHLNQFLGGIIVLFSCITYANEQPLPKLVFKLTQGQGTEVCEAYLQRLNTTRFSPTTGPLAGINKLFLSKVTELPDKSFTFLKRVPLTIEELVSISDKTIAFSLHSLNDVFRNHWQLKSRKENLEQTEEAKERSKKNHERHTKWFSVYIADIDKEEIYARYEEKLDLDNDGVATDTVIRTRDGDYIFDDKLTQIDGLKTMEIFADKDLLEWPTILAFPPLAISTNIFKYKGKYYFNGFNWLFSIVGREGYASIKHQEPVKIGVFIHQKGNTQRVCEYLLLNNSSDYSFWL